MVGLKAENVRCFGLDTEFDSNAPTLGFSDLMIIDTGKSFSARQCGGKARAPTERT